MTGCIDPSKSTLDPADAGGQLDVRFPNGAQCTFGGYGASFIELCVSAVTSIALPAPYVLSNPRSVRSPFVSASARVEPGRNRFCLRCCASPDDQVNCNSHRDRLGCEVAVPGQYDFPAVGVSCV